MINQSPNASSLKDELGAEPVLSLSRTPDAPSAHARNDNIYMQSRRVHHRATSYYPEQNNKLRPKLEQRQELLIVALGLQSDLCPHTGNHGSSLPHQIIGEEGADQVVGQSAAPGTNVPRFVECALGCRHH